MKKKGYIVLISILLFSVLVGIGRVFLERYQNSKLEKHMIEEYGFEISYPKTYKDIGNIESNMSEILSNLSVTESGEQISEYMQSINLVKTVKNLKNEKNGIKLLIEAINTEKTTLSLDEICNRYVVMFKIYNEDKTIKNSSTQIVKLDEKEAGMVKLKIVGEKEDAIVLTYLLSLDEKEITITFIAPESSVIKFKDEINKIINSLKVY